MKRFYEFLKEKIPNRILELVNNRNSLTPTDIYDFYYLCAGISSEQINLRDHFLAEFYLREIRETYLNVFTELLTRQIEKYVGRGRFDKSFDVRQLRAAPLEQKFELIKDMMKRTYRSDMVRRNDVWIDIALHLQNLSKHEDAKNICYYIDRINNSVHNTAELVLDKLPNARGLLQAFDTAHNSRNPGEFRRFVSPEVRKLVPVWTVGR
jgi:hypothetical protein